MTWKPGQSGNPAGRQTGTRVEITNAFLKDLNRLWRKEGPGALDAALARDPVQFCKMVAGLLPKELVLDKRPEADMPDEELIAALDYWRGLAAARIGSEAPGSGIGATDGTEQASVISPVH